MPRSIITAALSGFIFGVGLSLAGMLNPSKVSGFLDIFGLWDPSLAFVMVGGISVNATGYFLFASKGLPWFTSQFHLPRTTTIDMPLIAGSALFGIGWGMAGLCPGPVVSSLFLNPAEMFFFLAVMCAGLKLGSVLKVKLWSKLS
tara:strand:- start:343 stop:777 length:435 start_codon:yes stop_codon:yes gene_type:complete